MVIDTVENADEIGAALAQHAFEAKTLLGAHNFPCIRRAHGGELIGKNKRAFEKIDIAVKFQKLRRKKARIEIQQTPIGWPEDSLKAEIVNRKNRFCRGQFRVASRLSFQKDDRQGGLPIVPMHDIHALAAQ